MNKNYAKQAKTEALELIARGHDPQCLTHIIEFPQDYYLNGIEFQHLSTPLPPDSGLSGHTSTYYTLAELADYQ